MITVQRTFIDPEDPYVIYHPGDAWPRPGRVPGPGCAERLAAEGWIRSDEADTEEPKAKSARKRKTTTK